ncbi:DUF4142 domain-containing protein [Anditalea andensis]|uniref:DUF4142 domain-containing protein n=1 Tax=Anditalea andensis TaxID=1048983 RepID=A0A074L219_9BACT|nr:DUF4142 domain-containing protein [Anditalea andensis]KEO73918.1 hypothetical protein EL17_10505 [Anditalea andensis]
MMVIKKYNTGFILYSMMVLVMASCNMDQHLPAEEAELTQEDELFMTNAAHFNRLGLEYARLAEQNSTDGLILAYAIRMNEEYGLAKAQLETLAESYEITIADSLPHPQQTQINNLAAYDGEMFDSLYIQKNIEAFIWGQEIMEGQVATSNVQELEGYASQQLAQINQRLYDAQLIQSEIQQ